MGVEGTEGRKAAGGFDGNPNSTRIPAFPYHTHTIIQVAALFRWKSKFGCWVAFRVTDWVGESVQNRLAG